ncbi:hypothetical protein OIU84_006337, partial [Salix udensis]
MRKQNKRDASRASLGKEEELINPTAKDCKARSNSKLKLKLMNTTTITIRITTTLQ